MNILFEPAELERIKRIGTPWWGARTRFLVALNVAYLIAYAVEGRWLMCSLPLIGICFLVAIEIRFRKRMKAAFRKGAILEALCDLSEHEKRREFERFNRAPYN